MKYVVVRGGTDKEIYLKGNRFAVESYIKKAKSILLKMGYTSTDLEYLTKQEFSKRKGEHTPPTRQ